MCTFCQQYFADWTLNPWKQRPYFGDPRSHITRKKTQEGFAPGGVNSQASELLYSQTLMMGGWPGDVVEMMMWLTWVGVLTMTIVRNSDVFQVNFLCEYSYIFCIWANSSITITSRWTGLVRSCPNLWLFNFNIIQLLLFKSTFIHIYNTIYINLPYVLWVQSQFLSVSWQLSLTFAEFHPHRSCDPIGRPESHPEAVDVGVHRGLNRNAAAADWLQGRTCGQWTCELRASLGLSGKNYDWSIIVIYSVRMANQSIWVYDMSI